MNKLDLPGKVWIASDIHLGPDTPLTFLAFKDFLNKACAQADALILCGDIFDAWIGDDVALHRPPAWLSEALAQFSQVAQRLPLWLGRGNRDFLIGSTLTEHLGARLLPEPAILDTDAGRILLTHGDEYCTDDPAYQRFRRLVRTPWVQRAYLSLSLTSRQRIAHWARSRSRESNQYKDRRIMDVNQAAIKQALSTHDVSVLVHGHTHRPAKHSVEVDGRSCSRYVLPDWDADHGETRGGWLEISGHGIELKML